MIERKIRDIFAKEYISPADVRRANTLIRIWKVKTMRKTTIDIPIYQCKLTIILDKDLSYVEKKYRTKSLSDYGAVTMRVPNKFSEYVMAFEYSDGTIIAHEIVHLKNYIYQDCSIELDRFNDEPEAYLTGWLFKQIDNFLNK